MKIRNLAALLAISLTACGGIGSGSKPERLLFVNSTTDLTDKTTHTAVQCVASNPILISRFTDGSAGIFNTRATYTSSNPSAIRVSNGEIPIPGGTAGQFYERGTLLAVGANGTSATISAEFAGLRATLAATVAAPVAPAGSATAIQLKLQEYKPSDNSALREVERMVTSTSQQMRALTVLNGVLTNITLEGRWSLDAADSAVATIGAATGVFTAVGIPAGATTSTQTARVTFPACDASLMTGGAAPSFSTLTRTVTLDNQARLVIVPEQGYTTRMVRGMSQAIRTLAQYDLDSDGNRGIVDSEPEQDLSLSGVAITSNDTGTATASSALFYNIFSTQLFAAAVGSADISASFGTVPLTTIAPVNYVALDATLNALTITPASIIIPALNAAGNFNTQQFNITGTFTPAVTGTCTPTPCDTPLQHDVVWTSSDATLAFMGNSALNAGMAFVLRNPSDATPVNTTITATSTGFITNTPPATTNPSATATLTVNRVP